MNGKIAIIPLLGCVAAFTACKPTENNYRAAYDVAQQKKQELKQSAADGEVKDFTAIDGPSRDIIGNDTIFTSQVMVKAVEPSPAPGKGRIGVAISKFGMITNARRQAEDLRGVQPDVFVAIDGDGNHYVVIDRCENLKEAVNIVSDFKSRHKDYPYIGLPENPVTVVISE